MTDANCSISQGRNFSNIKARLSSRAGRSPASSPRNRSQYISNRYKALSMRVLSVCVSAIGVLGELPVTGCTVRLAASLVAKNWTSSWNLLSARNLDRGDDASSDLLGLLKSIDSFSSLSVPTRGNDNATSI